LDVMQHAENPYFNQDSISDPLVDTIKDDVRKIIKYDSYLYKIDNNNTNSDSQIETMLNRNESYLSSKNFQNENDSTMSDNNILDTEITKEKNERNNEANTTSTDTDTDTNTDTDNDTDTNTNTNTNTNTGTDTDGKTKISEDNSEFEKYESESSTENITKDLDLLIRNVKEKVNSMMTKEL